MRGAKVCLIPARGGSKRIPRKNIKEFHGKPIIAYSIEAALSSGCFDRVIVSTDDTEIAEVARTYGAEIPFARPAEISNDTSTTMDVIQHAIQWLEDVNYPVELICCVYATAPFVTTEDITAGLQLLDDLSVYYSFTATNFSFPIQRGFYLNQDGSVVMFQPQHLNSRSQDLVESYHDAGQFYWGKVFAFKEGLPLFGTHSRPVLLPRLRVQDIDTIDDWTYAEKMFEVLMQ